MAKNCFLFQPGVDSSQRAGIQPTVLESSSCWLSGQGDSWLQLRTEHRTTLPLGTHVHNSVKGGAGRRAPPQGHVRLSPRPVPQCLLASPRSQSKKKRLRAPNPLEPLPSCTRGYIQSLERQHYCSLASREGPGITCHRGAIIGSPEDPQPRPCGWCLIFQESTLEKPVCRSGSNS